MINNFNMPQSIPTLKELAFMYQTDKLEHGYIPFYQQHLPDKPKKILEIGVKEGRSIQMWLKYFPDAIVHGLDLFKEFPVPFQHERVVWHQGNQCDWELLEQLRKEDFDVIIDDGSHNARDQMMTFFGLFNGKKYFIEDLHCNSDKFYQQSLPLFSTAHWLFKTAQYSNKNEKWHERSGLKIDFSENENIILIKCS